jgi:RND family efflux transporter MFP subunit
MIAIRFLMEWAVRSSILILGCGLLLRVLRAKDPAIRLAAWTAVLFGSLAMPLLTVSLPKTAVAVLPKAVWLLDRPAIGNQAARTQPAEALRPGDALLSPSRAAAERFDWMRPALAVYVAIVFVLLLRLAIGAAMSLRILRGSRATGRSVDGIEVRESVVITAPVALGIAHPAIVVPSDWRQWSAPKLDAVLAHERSHIRRLDPTLQLISAIHRALLWFGPLSWFLHQWIVRAAEEASDDAALSLVHDRALYAEVLLEFMRRGVRNAHALGVPMGRYGRPEDRIHRILNATALSNGVTRRAVVAIAATGALSTYAVVAVRAASSQPPHAIPARSAIVAAAAQPSAAKAQTASEAAQTQPAPAVPRQSPAYLTGIGEVAPSNTAVVKSRIDGQLKSVDFKEGELVQAGELLASVDGGAYELQVKRAQEALDRDLAALAAARDNLDRDRNSAAANLIPSSRLDDDKTAVSQIDGRVAIDRTAVEEERLQLSYSQIRAPITGLTGLRLIDPGNMVHSGSEPIVVITQLQPADVLFTVPEDQLPQVLRRLRQPGKPLAEVWNRDESGKIASGHLIAVDNEIDPKSGTAKLKAEFDNKDGALFSNQFVNVRLYLNAH